MGIPDGARCSPPNLSLKRADSVPRVFSRQRDRMPHFARSRPPRRFARRFEFELGVELVAFRAEMAETGRDPKPEQRVS